MSECLISKESLHSLATPADSSARLISPGSTWVSLLTKRLPFNSILTGMAKRGTRKSGDLLGGQSSLQGASK